MATPDAAVRECALVLPDVRSSMAWRTAAALALVFAVGCSGEPLSQPTAASPSSGTPPVGETAPSTATPVPSPTSEPSLTVEETEPAEPPDAQASAPLVVATHLTLPQQRLTSGQLRRLLSDGDPSAVLDIPGQGPTSLVVAPGVDAPPGATQADRAVDVVRAVRRDPRIVGLLPGHAVDPTVRAALVGGVDPLRSPAEYPVTTTGTAPTSVVTISVGGDVMMDRRVGELMARTGDFSLPFRGIADRLASADITMVNLESTLATLGPPTQGIESFAADPRSRAGLRLAGVDVVSLANNHSGDFGPRSLLRTIERLRDGGFAVFGAGSDISQADRPAVLVRDGITVAFVGFNAIGETPPAGPSSPGASSLSMPPRTGPLDRTRLDVLTSQVAELSDRVDVVVVVPHWGTQYTSAPVAEQSEVGRALLAAGADIVVGGHPHWVQAVERRGGRLVVHSLGNLVFDMDFSVETMEGVVAELVVWDDRVVAVDYVPYVIGADWAPRWVDPTARGRETLERMWTASSQPFASAE